MRERPAGVWVVSAYIAATQLGALFGVLRAMLFSDPDTEWATSYFGDLPPWAVGYLVVNAVVWLCAGIALFLLHRQAFPLFIAAAVLGSANLVWQTLRPWTERAPLDQDIAQPLTTVGLLISAAILVAMLVYVSRLKKSGLLR